MSSPAANFRPMMKNAFHFRKSTLGTLSLILLLITGMFSLLFWGTVAIGDKPWRETVRLFYEYNGSLGATMIAILALGIAAETLTQKMLSDDRDAFYARVQWAIDLTLDDNPARQTAGWYFLQPLAESGLRMSEDEHFANAVAGYNERYNPEATRHSRLNLRPADEDNKRSNELSEAEYTEPQKGDAQ